MDALEVAGKRYQVVVTHEDGRAELTVRCEGSQMAALLIDECGVSSVYWSSAWWWRGGRVKKAVYAILIMIA